MWCDLNLTHFKILQEMFFFFLNFKRCSFRFASLKVYIKRAMMKTKPWPKFLLWVRHTLIRVGPMFSPPFYTIQNHTLTSLINISFFFSTNVIVGLLLHIFVLSTWNKSLHTVASISLILHMTKPPHVNLFYLLINRIYLYFQKYFISSPFFCIFTSLP